MTPAPSRARTQAARTECNCSAVCDPAVGGGGWSGRADPNERANDGVRARCALRVARRDERRTNGRTDVRDQLSVNHAGAASQRTVRALCLCPCMLRVRDRSSTQQCIVRICSTIRMRICGNTTIRRVPKCRRGHFRQYSKDPSCVSFE